MVCILHEPARLLHTTRQDRRFEETPSLEQSWPFHHSSIIKPRPQERNLYPSANTSTVARAPRKIQSRSHGGIQKLHEPQCGHPSRSHRHEHFPCPRMFPEGTMPPNLPRCATKEELFGRRRACCGTALLGSWQGTRGCLI